jgi:hypothetical protein
MRVSEWLREYQISGAVPDHADPPMLAFWAGWLVGVGTRIDLNTAEQRIEMAIKAAEFIEAQK